MLEVTCFNSMSNDGWWTTALVVLNVQVGVRREQTVSRDLMTQQSGLKSKSSFVTRLDCRGRDDDIYYNRGIDKVCRRSKVCPSGPLGLRFADCKIPHPPTPWGESGRTGGEGAIPGENRGQAPMHQKAQCIAIMRRGLQMLRFQCIAQHRSHMEGTFGGLLTRGTLVAFEPFQY